MNIRKMLAVFFFLNICISGCSPARKPDISLSTVKFQDDGIAVGAPNSTQLNVERINQALGDIAAGEFGEIHAMLIYTEDLLVVEEYFSGHDYQWDEENFQGALVNWDANKRHNIHSVGKSITSACVGIAVKKGFINSVHEPIPMYLPSHQAFFINGKEKITIEHLLTMTSGLAWDEWGSSYASRENDVIRLWLECEEPVSCILEKPLVNTPGSTFNYSGGDMVLLGEILKQASGMDLETFSWKYLFEPLGIHNPPWSWIDSDVVYAGGDQLLTPREMLKFGVLYLNGGKWENAQILPDRWVENSAKSYRGMTWRNSILKNIPPGDSTGGKRGYGYTWWTHEFRLEGNSVPAFFALGFGGQKIFVLPQQDTVVVITAGNYTTKNYSMELFREQILPALLYLD